MALGQLYFRDPATGNWVATNDPNKVNKAGDTMTGPLSGTTPTLAAHLTRKDYVDQQLAAKDHGTLVGLGDDDHPQYVKKAGDTLSGDLTITKATPMFQANASSGDAVFVARGDSFAGTQWKTAAGALRWYLAKANDANGALTLHRYDDAGAWLGQPISVNRQSGEVTFANPATVPNATANAHALNRGYADGRYILVGGDAGSVDGFSFAWNDPGGVKTYCLMADAPGNVTVHPPGRFRVAYASAVGSADYYFSMGSAVLTTNANGQGGVDTGRYVTFVVLNNGDFEAHARAATSIWPNPGGNVTYFGNTNANAVIRINWIVS